MTNSQCFSRFSLEKYFLQNLDTLDNSQLKNHLLTCTTCTELVHEIENERTAFLVKKPFEPFYNRLENKIKQRHWTKDWIKNWIKDWIATYRGLTDKVSQWFSWKGLIPLASMGLLLIVFRFGFFTPNEVRFKGNSEIGFYILDHGESVKGKRIQTVQAGNQIRLYSNSSLYPYVIIYGIEDDGTLNRYYPDRGETSFPVPVGERTLLPDSIILDASPHNELFVGVFSEHPLLVSTIEVKLLEHFAELKQQGKSIKEWESTQFNYPQSVFYLEKK